MFTKKKKIRLGGSQKCHLSFDFSRAKSLKPILRIIQWLCVTHTDNSNGHKTLLMRQYRCHVQQQHNNVVAHLPSSWSSQLYYACTDGHTAYGAVCSLWIMRNSSWPFGKYRINRVHTHTHLLVCCMDSHCNLRSNGLYSLWYIIWCFVLTHRSIHMPHMKRASEKKRKSDDAHLQSVDRFWTILDARRRHFDWRIAFSASNQ